MSRDSSWFSPCGAFNVCRPPTSVDQRRSIVRTTAEALGAIVKLCSTNVHRCRCVSVIRPDRRCVERDSTQSPARSRTAAGSSARPGSIGAAAANTAARTPRRASSVRKGSGRRPGRPARRPRRRAARPAASRPRPPRPPRPRRPRAGPWHRGPRRRAGVAPPASHLDPHAHRGHPRGGVGRSIGSRAVRRSRRVAATRAVTRRTPGERRHQQQRVGQRGPVAVGGRRPGRGTSTARDPSRPGGAPTRRRASRWPSPARARGAGGRRPGRRCPPWPRGSRRPRRSPRRRGGPARSVSPGEKPAPTTTGTPRSRRLGVEVEQGRARRRCAVGHRDHRDAAPPGSARRRADVGARAGPASTTTSTSATLVDGAGSAVGRRAERLDDRGEPVGCWSRSERPT